MDGQIKKVFPDKGFGFIRALNGKQEYFFHRSAVRGTLFESLNENDKVTFDVSDGQKGPRADNVQLAN